MEDADSGSDDTQLEFVSTGLPATVISSASAILILLEDIDDFLKHSRSDPVRRPLCVWSEDEVEELGVGVGLIDMIDEPLVEDEFLHRPVIKRIGVGGG